tara:strand:- start:6637 stop:7254 length:618 start_codon:yes stop_codon:yes gene_type:complete
MASEKDDDRVAENEDLLENEEDNVIDDWDGEEWGDEEEDEGEKTGIQIQAPAFVDNLNDTVSDTRSNLMWTKIDSFHEYGYGITWYEAHDFCEELNERKFAGFDDWRLPGFDEAKTLFCFDRSNNDKDGAEVHIDPSFETGGGDNTWTYEEKPDYHQYAMKFSYITGNEKWENKDNEYSHARAVREEVKEEWEPQWRKDTRKFDG